MAKARSLMHKVSNDVELKSVPMLVFANKSDLQTEKKPSDIKEELKIDSLSAIRNTTVSF